MVHIGIQRYKQSAGRYLYACILTVICLSLISCVGILNWLELFNNPKYAEQQLEKIVAKKQTHPADPGKSAY